MNGNVTAVLSKSRIYRGYTKAFTGVTSLPLSLCSLDTLVVSRIKQGESRWTCAPLRRPHCTCKCCARAVARMSRNPPSEPGVVHFARCPCGTLLPVRSGKDLIALLKLGPAGGERLPPRARRKREQPDTGRPSCSKHHSLSPTRYRAAVKLAGIFAQQLSDLCNKLLVQTSAGDPEVIRRTKDFITQHHGENISSRLAAKEVHMSRSHFCAVFKRSTGATFTEYLMRVRVERVKELLANPNLRISEIAFRSGFQSLTHFNRVFLNITGESPTGYRQRFRAM